MDKKTAIILFNLGGPDSIGAVRSFLFNLFYDKEIIRVRNPFRWIIAKVISLKREKTAQEIYNLLGGKSPILEETKKQADLLEKKLNAGSKSKSFEVLISMRYWHPFAEEVISYLAKAKGEYKELILLPLYPQFSTTTSRSSIKDFLKKSEILNLPTKTLCCFYQDAKFIEAHVEVIKKLLNKLDYKKAEILFSAHGLPESIIKAGDPYQWQTEKTASLIMKELNIKIPYRICYQSRVGPMRWLEPSTEKEIKRCAQQGKEVLLVPISFVSEHSETLVELDIEYKRLYYENGGMNYVRVPSLSRNKKFIDSLASLCLRLQKKCVESKACSSMEGRDCPKKFTGCINDE